MVFLARAAALVAAAAAVSAWPIVFYPTKDCQSEPVAVLEGPPHPGLCGYFHEPVKSYSGGTEDGIQKLLLYYDPELCPLDAAHRVYSNHTINNSTNECIPFKKKNEHPLAFAFIEEHLPLPNKTSSIASPFRVQY